MLAKEDSNIQAAVGIGYQLNWQENNKIPLFVEHFRSNRGIFIG